MSIDSYFKPGYSIKSVTNTPDGAGSFTKTYTEHANVSGRMRPLTGSEILANEKLGAITTHRFYCPVITVAETDRIYDENNDRIYDIKFIKNPMEMDDHLEIDCEQIR